MKRKKKHTHDNDDDGDNDEKFVCICVHAHLILMMIALTSLRSLNVFSAVQFLCNTHIHIGAKPPLRLFRSPAHSHSLSVSLSLSRSFYLYLDYMRALRCNHRHIMWQSVDTVFVLFYFSICSFSVFAICLSYWLLLWHEGISTNRLEHIRLAIIIVSKINVHWCYCVCHFCYCCCFCCFFFCRHHHCRRRCCIQWKFNSMMIAIIKFISRLLIFGAVSQLNYWERIRFRRRQITSTLSVSLNYAWFRTWNNAIK